MIRRVIRWAGGTIAAVLVLFCMATAWLVATESGARWLLSRASPRLPAALRIEEVNGTLISSLNFRTVSWKDAAATVTVAEIDTGFELLPFLKREARINFLDIRDVDVSITSSTANSTNGGPFGVDLPITLRIETASIRNVHLTTSGNQVVIEKIQLGGELSRSSLQIERFDLQSELGDISLSGDAVLNGTYATNAIAAWELRLQDQPPLSGILKLHGDTSRYDVVHELDLPYEIETRGTLALVGNRLSLDLANTWQRVHVEAGEAPATELLDGSIRVAGPLRNLAFEGATTVATGDIPAVVVETRGEFVGDRIDFTSLSAFNDWGRLDADGEVAFSPELDWTFNVELSDLDPAIADQRLAGKLNFAGTTGGRLVEQQPVLDLNVDNVSGDLNGHPVDGNGKLSYANEQLQFNDTMVRVGDNRIDLDGTYGRQLQLDTTVRFSDLSQFGVGVAGTLNADMHLVSDARTLQASGIVSGESLAWDNYLVDAVNAEFSLPAAGDGTIALQVSSAEQGSVSAEIDGRLSDQQWSGVVKKLTVRREPAGEWTLQEAADISLSQARLTLERMCLANPSIDGLVCSAIDYDFSGPLQFESSVNALPVAALPRDLPAGAIIQGEINAEASGVFADGKLNANASVQIDGLALVANFEGDEVAAKFDKALINGSVVDNKLFGEFEFRLDNGVDHAAGGIEIADLFDPGSVLLGRGNLEFNDLSLASFFVPDLVNPVGRIFGRIDASGSLMAPEIAGELGLSNGSVDVRRAGISVAEIEILLRQSKAGELSLSGGAKSGDGYLDITGETSLSAETGVRTDIRLDGENFTLLRLPDMQATASPSIAVLFDENETRVTGELGIPEANITVRSVPERTDKSSVDAVVHRADAATETPRRLLYVDVTTNLGEQVIFSGFGLTTGLDGSLRITGDSKSPFQGFGRVVLREGRYQAYGQNLEIESGELVFNGPLTNPALNVRATRTASDKTVAGIHLTGTPASLNSEVYSEPALGDAEALSYLLTGRPLNSANSEEGDMLNQAAFALGLSTAGSVASSVRNQLGLETLGIQGGAENRQLVAGKRFGGRLFVEYAYGVVDNLGTLLVRYQLSRRLMVESRSGSVRIVDIVYSVKKR